LRDQFNATSRHNCHFSFDYSRKVDGAEPSKLHPLQNCLKTSKRITL